MQITCTVLQESSRKGSDGREWNSVLLLETGANAMAQIWEYGLTAEEQSLRGKLAGKTVVVECSAGGQIMGLFNGRIKLSGCKMALKN